MALQQLRKGASGFIAKTFILLLSVSFLIWGIADVFRGYGASSIATVGGTDIPADAFRARYLEQVQQIGQRTGRGITPEQARAFGLDRQVLGQMITDATLDEQARRLGLAVGDEQLVAAIRDNPAYRRPGANAFDPAYFQQLLRSNGLTEQRFLNEERQRALREMLVQSYGTGLAAPKVLQSAADRYENEMRDVSYITVTAAAAGAPPAPTEEQLRTFYDAHKVTFRAPEFRKVNVLALTPEELAATLTVSDEEARDAYQREAARFGTPEKREVSQIVFPDRAAADEAAAKIKAGTAFTDIATARGLAAKDTDLGLVDKRAIIDPKVAEAAFATSAGQTSQPVESRFGFALVHVSKVEPGVQKPYEEVAADLKKDLAVEKARRALLDKHDAIEDERASGSTLAETAKKLGFSLTNIPAVDRSGRDPAGAEVRLPARADVIAGAFASEPGVETDTVQLPQNGGFVWYETVEITPSRERPFDEVKALVAQRWTEDEAAKRVTEKAKELLAKAEAGTALAQVASEAGLQVSSTIGLKRGRASGDFPAPAVARVFEVKEGGFGSASAATAPDMLVFQVNKVIVPDAAPAEGDQARQLSLQMENDLLIQYLAAIQKQINVTINERVLNQSVGSGIN